MDPDSLSTKLANITRNIRVSQTLRPFHVFYQKTRLDHVLSNLVGTREALLVGTAENTEVSKSSKSDHLQRSSLSSQ